MGITRGLLKSALDWLLPPLCLGCRRSPSDGIDLLNLCRRCRERCRPLAGRRCPGCLLRIEDGSAGAGFPCGACRRRPPSYERVLAGWAYEAPFEAVVVGLKFQRLLHLGEALGAELAVRYRAELAGITTIVPVPLHPWRSLRRGYNQAGVIADGIARGLDLPVTAALGRSRSTAPQTGLDRRQRRANLRGAFKARRRAVTALAQGGPEVHWLVVDDVFTTGATLESAAGALRRLGVPRISALVAAYRPHPRRPPVRT